MPELIPCSSCGRHLDASAKCCPHCSTCVRPGRTVVAALGLGVVNKFLEPVSGAVLGKIFVLGFLILFIQRRPQGIFALKGRAAET